MPPLLVVGDQMRGDPGAVRYRHKRGVRAILPTSSKILMAQPDAGIEIRRLVGMILPEPALQAVLEAGRRRMREGMGGGEAKGDDGPQEPNQP